MEPTSLEGWLEVAPVLRISDFASLPPNTPISIVAIDHLNYLLLDLSTQDDNPFEKGTPYDPVELFEAVRKTFTKTKNVSEVRLIHAIDHHLVDETVPAIFGEMIHADGTVTSEVLVYGMDNVAHTGAGVALTRYVMWDIIVNGDVPQIYYG